MQKQLAPFLGCMAVSTWCGTTGTQTPNALTFTHAWPTNDSVYSTSVFTLMTAFPIRALGSYIIPLPNTARVIDIHEQKRNAIKTNTLITDRVPSHIGTSAWFTKYAIYVVCGTVVETDVPCMFILCMQ